MDGHAEGSEHSTDKKSAGRRRRRQCGAALLDERHGGDNRNNDRAAGAGDDQYIQLELRDRGVGVQLAVFFSAAAHIEHRDRSGGVRLLLSEGLSRVAAIRADSFAVDGGGVDPGAVRRTVGERGAAMAAVGLHAIPTGGVRKVGGDNADGGVFIGADQISAGDRNRDAADGADSGDGAVDGA